MSLVAVCAAPGTAAATTTGLVVAASVPAGEPVVFAECDPSGGDVAAWAQQRETPGWRTAVASGDRSWSGLQQHLQRLPSGLSFLAAPTRTGEARVVIREAASRFAAMLSAMSDVLVVADCGRVVDDSPPWARSAQLVLLVMRQSAGSAYATVARVDRAAEAAGMLHRSGSSVHLLVVGARPYPPAQVAEMVGCELFGVLPEDPSGAGLAAGAWTIGRGASRSPLARAARQISARLVDAVATPSPVGSREHAEETA